ncbi:MAG TPA: hypothetical protein PKX84_04315, partial [Bacteroidia bacterium]|nr:hypothetical protein [Bacteroidia bacterium]
EVLLPGVKDDHFIAKFDIDNPLQQIFYGAPGTGKSHKIKEQTKATIRCIPLNNKQEKGKCILTGKPSTQRVLFARAY